MCAVQSRALSTLGGGGGGYTGVILSTLGDFRSTMGVVSTLEGYHDCLWGLSGVRWEIFHGVPPSNVIGIMITLQCNNISQCLQISVSNVLSTPNVLHTNYAAWFCGVNVLLHSTMNLVQHYVHTEEKVQIQHADKTC